METAQPALPWRDHTILGVCEGIGEDFGFNPLYLRILFAASLMWKPLEGLGAYLLVGAIVLLSRLLAPSRRPEATAEPVHADAANDEGAGELSIAA